MAQSRNRLLFIAKAQAFGIVCRTGSFPNFPPEGIFVQISGLVGCSTAEAFGWFVGPDFPLSQDRGLSDKFD